MNAPWGSRSSDYTEEVLRMKAVTKGAENAASAAVVGAVAGGGAFSVAVGCAGMVTQSWQAGAWFGLAVAPLVGVFAFFSALSSFRKQDADDSVRKLDDGLHEFDVPDEFTPQ